MGKVTLYRNYKVVVEPRGRGDFGFASIGGLEWTAEQEKRICEEIKDGIKKAAKADIIEDAGRIDIECDVDEVCEYCGAIWTEVNSTHNGGCCPQDVSIMDETD